jgi:hypothetical protein
LSSPAIIWHMSNGDSHSVGEGIPCCYETVITKAHHWILNLSQLYPVPICPVNIPRSILIWGLTNIQTNSAKNILSLKFLILHIHTFQCQCCAWNHFPKILSVLSSHYSECLEVIWNETLPRNF